MAVEVRHEPLLASKALVDEQVFLIMAHRVAKVNIVYATTVALELMHYGPMEVLVVHGIVGVKGGGIVIEDDTVVGMGCIVGAEVCNERRDFARHLQKCVDWIVSGRE